MSQATAIGLTPKRASALSELKSLLHEQNIERGRQLPSERELCAQLPISRGLLRSLLDDLESAGAIKRISARRRIVVDPDCVGPDASGRMASRALEGVIALLGKQDDSPDCVGFEDSHIAAADAEVEHRATRRAIASGYHALGVQWQRLVDDGGRWLLSQGPAGLVALRGASADMLRHAVEIGIPTVVFGELNVALGVPCVASDHRAGAAELARRTIAQGARRIARVWALAGTADVTLPWLDQRDRGYMDACAEAGIEAMPPIRIPHPAMDEPLEQRFARNARTIAGYLLEYTRAHGRIDAIMATNDAAAMETAEACRLLDIDPQRDVLITGYDNFYSDHPFNEFTSFVPALTVDKNNGLIGDALIDTLLDNASNPSESQHAGERQHLVPPTIVDPKQQATTSNNQQSSVSSAVD